MGLVSHGERHLLLAIGGYDVNIHIYLIPRITGQASEKTFKYKFSLLGHMNAIRGFGFSPEVGKSVRYMASCSQDSYVRMWKVQPLENISNTMGGH
jgi:WD40 repeat protein